MGGVAFDHLASVVLFLFCVWAFGRAFRSAKLPAVLGEFFAGVLLGPNCLDLVPYASDGSCPVLSISGRQLAEDSSSSGDCQSILVWTGQHTMDSWSFAGTVGVTLLITESGMHINFEKVRMVGTRALCVAVLGTALPLIFGMVLVGAFFGADRYYPDGFAAGCALAPTSVGISIKLLDDAKMLNSLAGQTTLTAAFVDDVFSLVLLVLLTALSEGDVQTWLIIVKTIAAFAFLGFGVLLSLYVFPKLFKLLEWVPQSRGASIQPRDEVHLLLMLISLVLFGYIGYLIGSHLLGAFVAGMCFIGVPRSHQIWVAQLKRIVRWLIRIFFAATVGFAVPLAKMLTLDAFLYGLALGLLPGILCKVVSGVAARMPYRSEHDQLLAAKASLATCGGRYQPLQYLVGMAMVARGEFAFLVAYQAQSLVMVGSYTNGVQDYMLSGKVYAAVTWSLVWALVSAPFLFKWALGVYGRASPVVRGMAIGGSSAAGKNFCLMVEGKHHTGVLHEVLNLLHAEGVDVLQARVEPMEDEGCDRDIFVLASRGKQKDFDDEKLHEMTHHLQEVIDDKSVGARVYFAPPPDEEAGSGSGAEAEVTFTEDRYGHGQGNGHAAGAGSSSFRRPLKISPGGESRRQEGDEAEGDNPEAPSHRRISLVTHPRVSPSSARPPPAADLTDALPAAGTEEAGTTVVEPIAALPEPAPTPVQEELQEA